MKQKIHNDVSVEYSFCAYLSCGQNKTAKGRNRIKNTYFFQCLMDEN